jgi:hypothetical protein
MMLFLRWNVHIPSLAAYAGRPGMKSQGFSTLRVAYWPSLYPI